MSPAVDLFCSTEQMQTDSKSRCRIAHREPGGGGINVARNLKRLGADVLAIFPAGGYQGQVLVQLLEQEQLPLKAIPVENETTQNIALTEEISDRHFHLVFPGAELSQPEWESCLECLRQLGTELDFLVLSGSLAPGIPPAFSAAVASAAKAAGIRVVLDASGEALKQASEAGVYLSKLNREDFAALGYSGSDDYQQRLSAMNEMVREGYAEVLVLTLGEDGALLASREGTNIHVKPQPVNIVSHVGAGDSFVSVMTWQLWQGASLEKAFCYGVAAAATAISTEGNQLHDLGLLEHIHSEGLMVTRYGSLAPG